MTLTAEFPLVCSALALAAVALLRVIPRRERRWADGLAMISGAVAALAPIALFPFVPAEKAIGRALWEWSAVGGPTIQASYRLDGIGAIGASAAAAYGVATLFAATRDPRRPPLLPAVVLSLGLATIALAVTDDLMAAIVLLGVQSAFTTAAAFLVMPPPAASRLVAHLAVGLQFFVLSALLLSRFGGASFQFPDIRATAISPGIVLAATIGAALFAGVYPFVPWRYEGGRGPIAERETLRGLLAMPAAIGASLVLLRLLGVTRTDLSTLGLPQIDPIYRVLAAIAIVLLVIGVALRHQVIPGRSIVSGAVLLLLVAFYPSVHWSHIVLSAALLSVLYAAASSLAIPEEWNVARYDVALAALWIGFALGTPVAIGAALALLVADGLFALGDSVWLPPHRGHLVLIAGAAVLVAGLGGMVFGVLDVADPLTVALALIGILAIFGLHVAHIERRVQVADPPFELDAASAATAFLTTALLATLLAPALIDGVAVTLGRPLPDRLANAPIAFTILAAVAVLIVATARSLRPLLPDLETLGRKLSRIATLSDPVPAGWAAFTMLDWTATHLASGFAFLERRAGVGLATLLIAALLIWSTR